MNKKDNKGRVLKQGERQRVDCYEYRYTRRGKTHSLYSTTLEGLRKKEEIIKNEIFMGNCSSGKNVTINQQYERWKKLKRGIKGNTFNNYVYMYDKYVFDDFGKNKLKEVRRSDIKEFYIELAEEKGLKANTIDTIQNVIYQVFEMAVDDDVIRSNPANRALTELKRSGMFSSKHREALTINEEKELVTFLENSKNYNPWLPLCTVMLWTGLRAGEVSALQHEDIDFKNNSIHVNKTLVYYANKNKGTKAEYEIHSPKTEAATRVIPMLPIVKEAILKEIENQKTFNIKCQANINGYDNFLFLNRFGGPYNQGTINKALRTIVQKCNEDILLRDDGKQDNLVPKISSHIFRHTFSTRGNESHMNDKARQTILGHKSIETTNNIYTDVSTDFMEEEMKKMEEHYKKQAQ